MGRGFVFSMDLAFAFFILMAIFYMIMLNYGFFAESALRQSNGFSLQRTAIYIADSLVKNSNRENPMLGAAVFDAEKRRVLENSLDYAELGKIEGMEIGGAFVKSVSLNFKKGSKEIIFEKNAPSENCESLERFVSVSGEKALVDVVVCRSEQ